MAKLKLKITEATKKISLDLKMSYVEALNDYALYMSDLHKVKVSAGTVVEGLMDTILKDKEFKSFRANIERKGASYVDKIPKKTKRETQGHDNETKVEKVV